MPKSSDLIFKLILTFSAVASFANAQNSLLICQPTASPILVRGEGLTERLGDIVLQCAGGIPNSTISGNLSVFLSVPITNRVDASGFTDLQFTVDNGNGSMPGNVRSAYLTPSNLAFSGLSFNLSPSGSVTLRLSNLRGAVNQLGLNSARQVTASLSFTAGSLVTLYNNVFAIGTAVRSLYSSSTSRLICSQYGTPPLTSLSFSDAIARNAGYSTIRVTEGFASSFGPHSDFDFQTGDFGTRILVRFTQIPAGVRLYVPNAVVGYDGLQPTSAGDYGLPPSGGVYAPGSGSLLLLRVATSDPLAGGPGSGSVIPVPNKTISFDSLSEVQAGPDGVAQAVFEVYDANPFAIQSATIPSFLFVPPNVVNSLTEIGEDALLGPTGTNFDTTRTAVIPRFAPVEATNDCGIAGDCNAGYFPHMSVNPTSLDVNVTTLDTVKTAYFTLSKSGGGHYIWRASVRYTGGVTGGSQWLKISPTSGLDRETIRVDFVPGGLGPGVYDAVILIDGGAIAGQIQVPVTMRLSFQTPPPVVTSAVNPANMRQQTLVPGSAVAILGNRLSGSKISVTFDGAPARLLENNSSTRLTVLVPDSVAGHQSSLVVVNVDGVSSTPGLKVPIAISAPVIFASLIQNSDSSHNSPDNPAVTGSTIQVLASGLPASGVYTGQIHDRVIDGTQMSYIGPAPGLIGVQMMAMVVPVDLPTMTTGVFVCGGASADAMTCSDSVDLTIVTAGSVDPPDSGAVGGN